MNRPGGNVTKTGKKSQKRSDLVKLLVVDDEKPLRDMLSRHFRFAGYDVATAENGRAALEYMRKNKVDILVTDIVMPEMDGLELTAAVRDGFPLVRMIVVTGYVTLNNAMICLQNGADAIFAKPVSDMEKLEKAVSRSVDILQEWADQLAILYSSKPLGTTGEKG